MGRNTWLAGTSPAAASAMYAQKWLAQGHEGAGVEILEEVVNAAFAITSPRRRADYWGIPS